MDSHITQIGLTFLLLAGPCLAAGQPLDDFERGARWAFSNGPEFPGAAGAFEVGPRGAHSGKMGGTLSFDFTGGGRYVQASIPLPAGVEIGGLELYVRKPCRNTLAVRVDDSEGQTFQKPFDIPHSEWQKVHVTLENWAGFFGGKSDGVFRGRPTRFALLVENNAAVKTGEVHFDDVRMLPGSAASAGAETEYMLSDFGPDDGWSLSAVGPAGESSLRDGNLRFDFSAGAQEIGLRNEIAVLGNPQKMMLTVESQARGCKVFARVLSHFQTFDKIIGELSGEGRQTIEVPMGGMTDWRHHGAENDGFPRWPLRIVSIVLLPDNGPSAGEVRFVSLKVLTKARPESAVVLVPEARLEKDTAHFSCAVTSVLPEAASGSIFWTIRDYAGEVLDRGSAPLKIGPGQTVRFAREFARGNRPFVECEFECSISGRAYGPVRACAVAPEARGYSELKPESMFGMGVYLYRYPDSPGGFERMEKAAAMAAAAGVKWSREEFNWSRIEPERGRYNWSFYDRMVDTALAYGISVYGLISYWSPWTKPCTPEGIADYAAYCKALVSRYKDKIKHWEVWNEPNIFFWTCPKEMYADLLKAAYHAIKEADPEAQVLGCSTAGIDLSFIKMVMDKGAPFDALTIHPYRAALVDDTFIRELQDVRALTAGSGGAPKDVWITEMGWPTDIPHGVSERQQAGLLSRAYLCSAASGAVRNVSWYDFREDGDCPFYNEHRLGIVRNRDLAPKPAYRALATVTKMLEGKRLVGRLDLGPGLLAYRFSDDRRDTLAIWSLEKDAILRLNLKGRSLRLRDLMGQSVPLKAGAETLVLAKASDPIFITGAGLEADPVESPALVDAPLAVRQGGVAKIRLSGPLPPGATLALDAPGGWKSAKKPNGFDVRVPGDSREPSAQLILRIKHGSSDLRVPICVRVSPLPMRV